MGYGREKDGKTWNLVFLHHFISIYVIKMTCFLSNSSNKPMLLTTLMESINLKHSHKVGFDFLDKTLLGRLSIG